MMKKRLLALGLAAATMVSAMPVYAEEAADGATGSVYYLNFKPEQDAQWQELAAYYTEQTGVPVTVTTAASGQYETMLTSEMGSSDAPTMFQVNGPVGLKNWKDYCYDLSGSALYGELTSDDYALSEDGAVYGIAYVIESYGIITNKTLLEQAGYTVEDIQSFEDLKAVAEDITARKDELGFAAFTSAGMDSSSDWRFKTHLANLPIYFEYQDKGITSTDAIEGTYLDNYRNIWDLYINNSTCDPAELTAKTANDSLNEFVNSEAVFYQNGSWEYANVVGEGKFTDDDVTMIPVYIGAGDEANQGLCTGSENYWCVNKNASEEDIQATLDFMAWCVTDETALKAMTGGEGAMPSGEPGMAFAIPFKQAPESTNLFVALDAQMTADGKTPVSWNFTTMPSEEWKNVLGSALSQYAADQTDDNWAGVVSAFVDNWAAEYALANG
ncbi:MAG TPA: ABC transporter substrate-binding protein [Candidatus Merdiplasma excrementigallinarum]|uniref:ABC transporter substrate-binding protein n=1 Tax=Candidatus Merdiplasma excrementigallinarum TaxID=2840864 RepID=A0A9D1NYT5_9FIRM|nr:ABC transporter substrate-binding protein [Candidatus Merdiplasma excrementigallinarum]